MTRALPFLAWLFIKIVLRPIRMGVQIGIFPMDTHDENMYLDNIRFPTFGGDNF